MATKIENCKCGVKPEVIREKDGKKRVTIFCRTCRGAVNSGQDEEKVIKEWNEGMAKSK